MGIHWIAWGIFVFLIVVMVILTIRYQADISPEEAKKLVNDGALLIDVRTQKEFSSGHIEGAINIPLSQINKRTSELGEKEKPLVLYCLTGMRSGAAVKKLQKKGFKKVYNLGRIENWKKD